MYADCIWCFSHMQIYLNLWIVCQYIKLCICTGANLCFCMCVDIYISFLWWQFCDQTYDGVIKQRSKGSSGKIQRADYRYNRSVLGLLLKISLMEAVSFWKWCHWYLVLIFIFKRDNLVLNFDKLCLSRFLMSQWSQIISVSSLYLVVARVKAHTN